MLSRETFVVKAEAAWNVGWMPEETTFEKTRKVYVNLPKLKPYRFCWESYHL